MSNLSKVVRSWARRPAPKPPPRRLTITEAAKLLAVHRETLWKWATQMDRFTVIRDGPAGRGQRVYLLSDEVEACVESGLRWVREVRYREGRI